jgi:MinD superfamily P-loop ATPase
MKIAVASGKGGVGKTTFSINLAVAWGAPIQLLDCDVEEPNVHLFFASNESELSDVVTKVPVVDALRCQHCGECARFCEYNAIASLPGSTLVFNELCHGCGGCSKVCPHGAISEHDRTIGQVHQSQWKHIHLVGGALGIGETLTPVLIRAVKSAASEGIPIILDAPPGTACPAVATFQGVDYIVLVAESTPFGLNDLQLMVDLVRKLEVPFSVAINRSDPEDDRVLQWCRAQQIDVIASLPDDRKIAEVCSNGKVLIEALPHFEPVFTELAEALRTRLTEAQHTQQGQQSQQGQQGQQDQQSQQDQKGQQDQQDQQDQQGQQERKHHA